MSWVIEQGKSQVVGLSLGAQMSDSNLGNPVITGWTQYKGLALQGQLSPNPAPMQHQGALWGSSLGFLKLMFGLSWLVSSFKPHVLLETCTTRMPQLFRLAAFAHAI